MPVPFRWVQGWRTSSTTGTYATTFSNVQDWVEHNKVFAKHAEAMGSLYESMTCYATGNITPEAKALCDFWNQAPWYVILRALCWVEHGIRRRCMRVRVRVRVRVRR